MLWVVLSCGCEAQGAREPSANAGRPAMEPVDAAVPEQDGQAPRAGPVPKPNIDAIFESGCATESQASSLLPSNLLFVLDRSASMACNPPPTTDSEHCEADPTRADYAHPSKWEVTRGALFTAIRELPPETVVGLSYFSNDDSCGVHQRPSVPLAALQRTHLGVVAASLDAVQPNGATPLVGATILAYRHLHSAALEGTVRGNKFVVLITDGSQSEPCTDPQRCSDATECTELLVEQEVPRAAGAGVGIKTFVVGVPGSEHARAVLSKIALHGGTAEPGCAVERGDCHFDMTTRQPLDEALQEALTEISGRALTCDFAVPQAGEARREIDLDLVNVIYSPGDQSEPQLLLQDAEQPCEGGADGWQYADHQTHIRLCGSVCERVRADHGARVDVVFGCPSRRPT